MSNNEKILVEQETAAGDGYASMFAQATAEKFKALASLRLLMQHPAGIGDHSTADYHRNLDEALVQLVDADDKLATLEKYFRVITST